MQKDYTMSWSYWLWTPLFSTLQAYDIVAPPQKKNSLHFTYLSSVYYTELFKLLEEVADGYLKAPSTTTRSFNAPQDALQIPNLISTEYEFSSAAKFASKLKHLQKLEFMPSNFRDLTEKKHPSPLYYKMCSRFQLENPFVATAVLAKLCPSCELWMTIKQRPPGVTTDAS